MQDNQRQAEDINIWKAVAAMNGIAMAMEWFLTEGPAAEQPMSRDARVSLNGLAHAGCVFANQIHVYLERLDAAGIELPRTQAELEACIKEPRARYHLV